MLTHAGKRVLFGQALENSQSRFMGDIEAALKEVRQARRRKAEKKAEGRQLPLF